MAMHWHDAQGASLLMADHASKHMKMLKRRAQHLSDRIKAKPGLSYDQSELAALRWAIKELEVMHEPNNHTQV